MVARAAKTGNRRLACFNCRATYEGAVPSYTSGVPVSAKGTSGEGWPPRCDEPSGPKRRGRWPANCWQVVRTALRCLGPPALGQLRIAPWRQTCPYNLASSLGAQGIEDVLILAGGGLLLVTPYTIPAKKSERCSGLSLDCQPCAKIPCRQHPGHCQAVNAICSRSPNSAISARGPH